MSKSVINSQVSSQNIILYFSFGLNTVPWFITITCKLQHYKSQLKYGPRRPGGARGLQTILAATVVCWNDSMSSQNKEIKTRRRGYYKWREQQSWTKPLEALSISLARSLSPPLSLFSALLWERFQPRRL